MVMTITSASRNEKNVVLAVPNPIQKLWIPSPGFVRIGSVWLEVM